MTSFDNNIGGKPKVAVSVVTFSKSNTLVDELRKYFDVNINTTGHRYTRDELIDALSGVDAAITGLDDIDDGLLDLCQNLKVISKHGIGIDKIDLDSCKNHGVKVLRKGVGLNSRSVSELVFSYMFGLMRGAYIASSEMKEGSWNKYDNGGRELTGKTIGIIGVGNIGKNLILLLKPFNCRILVNDIRDDDEQKKFYHENDIEVASKEEIYRNSDILTIHTPLTDLTRNMVAQEELSMMKPSSFLINTARGEIVNEASLLNALKNKVIAGAGLDVYTEEPPRNEILKELVSLRNVYCTPHMGGTSKESSLRLGYAAIEGLKEYFEMGDDGS